jgi:hypothetical protein
MIFSVTAPEINWSSEYIFTSQPRLRNWSATKLNMAASFPIWFGEYTPARIMPAIFISAMANRWLVY